MITILTPTYNRANTLPRLYSSLLNQSDNNFEWLVIDDGSHDSTDEIIKEYQKESNFLINYLYKENEGKHGALNIGFKKSQGDWIFIVDSDDWLDGRCVETLNNAVNKLEEDIFSISILRVFDNGRVVGDAHDESLHTYIERIEKGVQGDKGDVFKKAALHDFHFPVYNGERFMPESPLFIWFGARFKTKFINYPGYICEYQEGGLSELSIINRHKSYNSAMYVYSVQYQHLNKKILRYKAAVNWWRFRIGKRVENVSFRPPLIFSFLGVLLFAIDSVKNSASLTFGSKK